MTERGIRIAAFLLLCGGFALAGEEVTLVRPEDLLESPTATQDTAHGAVRRDGDVVRMESRAGSDEFWIPAVGAPTRAPVGRGDVVLITFRARCRGDGEGLVDVYFQRASAPWEKSLHEMVPVGPKWTSYRYPFRVRLDHPAGEAMVGFGAGRRAQVLEIAGVTVVDYGPNRDLATLPTTRRTYLGREESAAWRKEAGARIERFRKADLTVRVLDRKGRSVPGAAVRVRMLSHAFRFGSTIAVPTMMAGDRNAERYRATILELFNHASTENALKWKTFAPGGRQGSEADRRRTKECLKWLREQGLEVYGHVLLWPSWDKCPRDVRALAGDPEGLRAAIDGHIREMMSFTRGLVDEWDVLNEALGREDLVKVLGREEMARWFRVARRENPDARLYVNETGMLTGGALPNAGHQDRYLALIRFLLEHGAPVDGIGLQAHFRNEPTPPAKLLRDLDRFALLGLPILITEFDVISDDEDLQADYTRDFLTAAFSHPRVKGVCLWGFWEGRIWARSAALFREDWSAKRNGEVFRDLVLRRWWTDESGWADAGGRLSVRGFLGRYEITARAGDRTARTTMDLRSGASTVAVALE